MSRIKNVVTLDFETYYARDYSLRGMSTVEYITDPRFLAQFLCIKPFGKPVSKFPGRDIERVLRSIDWDTTAVIGHNLFFDGGILAFVYGIRPAKYIDTLGMARYVFGGTLKSHGLDAVARHVGLQGKTLAVALEDVKGVRDLSPQQEYSLGEYCAEDCEETEGIFKFMQPNFPASEYSSLDWAVRMFTSSPFVCDHAVLDELIHSEQTHKANVVRDSGVNKTALSSNPKFTRLLGERGVEVPTKISPRTGKEQPDLTASSKAFSDLLLHDDEQVRKLVAARLAVKSTINETRANTFKKVSAALGGTLPVALLYCGASQTNRLSGSEKMNQQNMGRGSKLRDSLRAPDGYKVVAIDLSNIELRTNMTLCKEVEALNIIRSGGDLYCDFASKIFKQPVTKEDKVERTVGKVGELSLGYGSAAATFQNMLYAQSGKTLWKPMDFCTDVVSLYRGGKPNVVGTWNRLKTCLNIMASGGTPSPLDHMLDAPVEFYRDRVVGPLGFSIKYPNLRWEAVEYKDAVTGQRTTRNAMVYDRHKSDNPGGVQRIWHGTLIENINQHLARDVLTHMHEEIRKQTGFMAALQVHDELVFVVPDAHAESFMQCALSIMFTPPPWWPYLMVAAEGAIGQTYGEAK